MVEPVSLNVPPLQKTPQTGGVSNIQGKDRGHEKT